MIPNYCFNEPPLPLCKIPRNHVRATGDDSHLLVKGVQQTHQVGDTRVWLKPTHPGTHLGPIPDSPQMSKGARVDQCLVEIENYYEVYSIGIVNCSAFTGAKGAGVCISVDSDSVADLEVAAGTQLGC